MNNNRTSASFPWANTEILAEAIRTGEITLPMAIRQVAAVDRESLKLIELVAGESEAFYNQSRATSSKNEKLIADLTEKCQAMQQALLYKEEQFHEKCRELERYKVICEMSARAACNDDLLFAKSDPNPNPSLNDNLLDFETNVLNKDNNNNNADDDNQEGLSVENLGRSQTKRTKLRHVKINASQLESRKNLADVGEMGFAEPSTSAAAKTAAAANASEKDNRQQVSLANETDTVLGHPDSHYWGGPCKRANKRRPPITPSASTQVSAVKNVGSVTFTLPERMRMIGGILGPAAKVSGLPTSASMFQPAATSSSHHQSKPTRSGTPMPMRDVNPNTTSNNIISDSFENSKDGAARVKVTLGGQSNEVLSSLKNISHGLKQKIVEKDLRRQVAECGWTRIARRKKEWPF